MNKRKIVFWAACGNSAISAIIIAMRLIEGRGEVGIAIFALAGWLSFAIWTAE